MVPPWEARAEQLSKPDMGEGLLQASIPWLPRLLAVPHDGGLDQWAAKATGVIPDSPFTDKERVRCRRCPTRFRPQSAAVVVLGLGSRVPPPPGCLAVSS